jgi:hypothetical protein
MSVDEILSQQAASAPRQSGPVGPVACGVFLTRVQTVKSAGADTRIGLTVNSATLRAASPALGAKPLRLAQFVRKGAPLP